MIEYQAPSHSPLFSLFALLQSLHSAPLRSNRDIRKSLRILLLRQSPDCRYTLRRTLSIRGAVCPETRTVSSRGRRGHTMRRVDRWRWLGAVLMAVGGLVGCQQHHFM